jgi:ABC-type spermidine/putrescine transport system permease subunit I
MFVIAIQDLLSRWLDWQTGSVLAMFLVLVVAALMAIFGRYVQVRAMAAD